MNSKREMDIDTEIDEGQSSKPVAIPAVTQPLHGNTLKVLESD